MAADTAWKFDLTHFTLDSDRIWTHIAHLYVLWWYDNNSDTGVPSGSLLHLCNMLQKAAGWAQTRPAQPGRPFLWGLFYNVIWKTTVLTKRRGRFCWSLQTPRCRSEWDPGRILLHLCPEGNPPFSFHEPSLACRNWFFFFKKKGTHLHKVHVYAVKLQPLAFVEERNLCLRWAVSPERRHNCHFKQLPSGQIHKDSNQQLQMTPLDMWHSGCIYEPAYKGGRELRWICPCVAVCPLKWSICVWNLIRDGSNQAASGLNTARNQSRPSRD